MQAAEHEESTPEPQGVLIVDSANRHPEEHHRRRRAGGALVLIALGLLFLAGNFGLLGWFSWSLYWPLILIGIGGFMLWKRAQT
jgi:fatty acid desaturase